VETAQAFSWAIARMKADSALAAAATGGVWQGMADIGTVAPYALVIAQVPGNDMLTMNGVRCFTHITLQLKAVGKASNYAALVTIADRIDALFKDVRNISLSPGYMLASYREQAIAFDEPPINGVMWSHLGGLYRVELQGA
jgi:hypothetical protein